MVNMRVFLGGNINTNEGQNMEYVEDFKQTEF